MTNTGHIADATLLARADGEAAYAWEDERHLAQCEACRVRAAAIDDANVRVARMLQTLVPPDVAVARVRAAVDQRLRSPRRLGRPTRMSWAAAAVAVVSVGALAAPVILDFTVRRQPGTPPSPGAVTRPATVRGDVAENIVSFAVQGSMLRVSFRNTPAPGSMTLSSVAGAEQATFVTRGGDVKVVVLPGALHVLNSAASAARFELRLPAQVRTVEIGVADSAAVLYRGGAPLDAPVTIP